MLSFLSYMANSNSIPLVSVVISTLNEAANGTLKNAVDSVYSQSYQNWELFVVGDCTSLASKITRQLRRYGDTRIHFMNLAERHGARYPGLGPKVKGIECSRGEFVAFLDADNQWFPYYLDNSIATFAQHPDADLVYSDALIYFSDTANFVWNKPLWSHASQQQMLRSNFIDMSEAVVKRSSYDASGGLSKDLPYAVDWALWLRMIKAGKNAFYHSGRVGQRYCTNTWDHYQNLLSAAETCRNGLGSGPACMEGIGDHLQRIGELKQEQYLARSSFSGMIKWLLNVGLNFLS